MEDDKAKGLLLGYTYINLNNKVEVRLTDKGRDVYYHKDDWMNEKAYLKEGDPGYFGREWPKEVDGWFSCQLWELMQIFGRHMGMSFDLMFETNMRIKA